MILSSAIVFLLLDRSDSGKSSSWITRLKRLSSPIAKLHPIVIGFAFFALISFELWLIIKIFIYNPTIIKYLYIFSITNVSFVSLSLWLDQYWQNQKIFQLLKLTASVVLGFSWVYYPEWFIYNVVGILGAVAFVSVFPSLNYWRMYAIGIAIVIYDVLGVYITGWIIDLVRGFTFTPPAVIMIPTTISSDPHIMVIGLGDIIIGALFLKLARQYNLSMQAFVSYSLAIILSYILAISTNHGVPATIFICPLMLLSIWLFGKDKHSFILNP